MRPLNPKPSSMRPVILKHLLTQIGSPRKKLIFTRNGSSSNSFIHTLFAPFQSSSKPVSSSLADGNTNPNLSSRLSSTSPLSSSFRFFSTSALKFHRRPKARNFAGNGPIIEPDVLSEIVELIRKDAGNVGPHLEKISLRLSHESVSTILRALNDDGVSSLPFFNWVSSSHPGFRPTSKIFNQIIDNLGRLCDFKTMIFMLNEYSLSGYCLTEKAFTFLNVSDPASLRDSVRNVVDTLNRVRGSCRGSGIYSLIKLLCAIGSFDSAIFVMEEIARRTSYYNVLIAAKCRNGDFHDAQDLLDEMKTYGCDPNINSYNYLLGALFKKKRIDEGCGLIQRMEASGYLPDSVTFEVITYHACKEGRMDFAIEFINRMLSEGINPRTTTHAAFIKGYFSSGRVEDAHKYVADMSTKDKYSSNMNYSLLASLFRVTGKVLEASMVLKEMMEKGLRPNFPTYMRVIKDLYKIKKGDLILELKSMFSSFNPSVDSK